MNSQSTSDFTIENPNRLRALANGLALNTNGLFYTEDGIRFFTDLIDRVDAFGNGQVASRLATRFQAYAKLTSCYQQRMLEAVKRLQALEG